MAARWHHDLCRMPVQPSKRATREAGAGATREAGAGTDMGDTSQGNAREARLDILVLCRNVAPHAVHSFTSNVASSSLLAAA